MGRVNSSLLSFNRGEIAKTALARVDLERMRLSAETQVNFAPMVIGPMMLRPGTAYKGATYANATSRPLPFVFSNDDTAILELTDSILRVWIVDDEADTETLVTRASVSTVVTNGNFSSSAGWTLASTSGCTADINSTVSGALYLAAVARGGVASCLRSVTVGVSDQFIEHGLRIVVTRGPVTFMCGSTSGGDEYISRTVLDTGTHSLAFTPTGATAYVKFENTERRGVIVDSITVESSGVMTVPTPWAADDLSSIRFTQSGDIVFLACNGVQQRKIERRSAASWSVVLFRADDGPFAFINTNNVTMTPSVYEGNGTLTASAATFETGDVGRLFRVFSTGQTKQAVLGALNAASEAIRVSGVDATDRAFNWVITGTWVGTIALQRSIEGPDSGFKDVATKTSNASTAQDDHSTFANVVAWYRMIFTAYTSGSAVVSFTGHTSGGGKNVSSATKISGAAGVCRVTSITSELIANIEVLSPFSDLTATDDWRPGEWSDTSGWPSSVEFHDGRLWWAGRDKLWGSVSDNYYSHDIDTTGDAGPINRSVGFGPVDVTHWLLSLTRLIAGRQGAQTSIRATQDEPLTPTNFTLKDCSTQGAYPLGAVKIDTRGVFIQQSGRRVYELAASVEAQDYVTHDLTRLNPNIAGLPTESFVDLAVQRQPDTQLHFPRDDGQSAVMLHDTEDQVEAWWRFYSSGATGIIESVCVLPGIPENRVYYVVKRTINGSTVRYLEKIARRDQCTGLPEARCSDAHVVYTGGTTTVTGLSHLEGASVVAWGWDDDGEQGSDCGTGMNAAGTAITTLTVSGGQITIPTAFDNVCVGLPYTAQFKSAKLAYGAQMGTALNQRKKINRIGLILGDTHYQGLQFGQSFTRMDNLPLVVNGAPVAADTVHEDFDGPMIPMPGSWDTDSRLCLQAASPRPAMVMGVVVDVTENETP